MDGLEWKQCDQSVSLRLALAKVRATGIRLASGDLDKTEVSLSLHQLFP